MHHVLLDVDVHANPFMQGPHLRASSLIEILLLVNLYVKFILIITMCFVSDVLIGCLARMVGSKSRFDTIQLFVQTSGSHVSVQCTTIIIFHNEYKIPCD